MKKTLTALMVVAAAFLNSYGAAGAADLRIESEKYELPNGLDVILHVDRSDPIAAVALVFHVGSSREVAGRTGFAHLFEHLFFLDSENLGYGGLDRLMARVGGGANGFTSRDQTNYYEVVPKDALEKTLWAEADKLGFFINTVTEEVVAKEKQVVKNEKRQGVDNRPYGHNSYVLDNALYPEGHPYSWQVIGSLQDLDAASLSDVKEFHHRWYGPNNATLTVAGDIDIAETKAWISMYFGEVPRREAPQSPGVLPVKLVKSRFLYHEDNFASLPQLTLTWPGVPLFHPDSYAMDFLADLLTDGRTTPFYKVIVQEDRLAPDASAFNGSDELAGDFSILIRAFPGTDLNAVNASVQRAFARFEKEGIPPEELLRVKAGYETAFYDNLSSTLGKAFELARYNTLAGDPGFVTEDITRALAVTTDDVLRVYETYIKGKPFVASSFVPKGETKLVVTGSEMAGVVEEPIVEGEGDFGAFERGEIAKTPSSFDRSVEPDFGAPPSVSAPVVWRETLSNGMDLLGIVDGEIPLVRFQLRIRGGLLAEDPEKIGVANLLAKTMTLGTAGKTPGELDQAIQLLGASIRVFAGRESFFLSASTLARNYAATMSLVEEILLEPRWDMEQFELAREGVLNDIREQMDDPDGISTDVFNRLLHGDGPLAQSLFGDESQVRGIAMEDLRGFHERALAPNLAAFHVAGSVPRDEVVASLKSISIRWKERDLALADPSGAPAGPGVYFVDVPGAKQSVLRIGYLALAETDPDFYPASVMNFRFGGGGFASDLMQVLREGKGYTYGVRSGFAGSDLRGPFTLSSSVRSNATFESLELIRDMMKTYGPEFDAEDLDVTRSFLLKSNAGAFETLEDKLGILSAMSLLGFPADYVLEREQITMEMTGDRVRELAARYLDPERMVWLVVGDAATQKDRLAELGLGVPVLLTPDGERVKVGSN